jgi:hypothetical protein
MLHSYQTPSFLRSFLASDSPNRRVGVPGRSSHPGEGSRNAQKAFDATPLGGREEADAWEFRDSQQKFKLIMKNNRKFTVNHKIFRNNMKK